MATKFVRRVTYSGTAGPEINVLIKLLYEFWGYVINCPSSVTVPGGTTASGSPANFFENTTPSASLPVMLAGTDGVTALDANTFTITTGTFTSTMVGKLLVMWCPGTPGSTEDSIYEITSVDAGGKIITINVNNGGAPHPSTKRPRLSTRTGLYYRVVNPVAVPTATAATTFTMTLDPATGPNTGSDNGKAVVAWESQYNLSINGYPNTSLTPCTGKVGTLSGQVNMYYGVTTGVSGYVTLIGDKDFLLACAASPNMKNYGIIHIELPKRIFSAAQDKNPLVVGHCGGGSASYGGFADCYESAGSYFFAVGYDNTGYKQYLCVRSLAGTRGTMNSKCYIPGKGLVDGKLTFNQITGKALLHDVAMSQQISGQYEFLRALMYRVKVGGSTLRNYCVLGSSGEWIHMNQGYCWPWDGTSLPYILL